MGLWNDESTFRLIAFLHFIFHFKRLSSTYLHLAKARIFEYLKYV